MDLHQKSLRIGAAALVCALLLRFFSGSVPQTLLRGLATPENLSFLLYLETGRMLRMVRPEVTAATEPEETAPPPVTLSPALAVFAPEDEALVEVNSVCG